MLPTFRLQVARAAAVAALLVASANARAETPKDTLVMAWNLDALITFDPAQIAEVNGNDIIRNVCSPLVAYDAHDVSKIVPSTAESWTVSPDGMTITFHLRKDLKFPDGTPATAADTAWSLQRAVLLGFGNSANLTQWGFSKDRIGEQIKAADDHTLVVKMDRPYPIGLILSAAFASNVSYTLSQKAGTEHAKTTDGKSDYGNAFFKTGPVCVGPYKVTRWNTNDVVILQRNDDFFGAKPHSKRVIIRHVPESGAERLLLEKGDVDVARLLNTDDLVALSKNPKVHIEQTPMHGFTYFDFNAADPILGNPKVRLAFRYLIDYDELGRTLLQYLGIPRASLVPLGAFGALDRKQGEPFKLDFAHAKQLLTEAGYPDGFSKKLILSANGINPALAQHLQANAAKVGIKLDIEQMADANLFTRGRARDFQIMLIGWGAGYPDADSMISRHAVNPDNRLEAKLAQYPSWRSSWQDPWVNEMADKARMEQDTSRRIQMYHEIQQYMMQNGPMAYVFQTVRSIAYRSTVKGFTISPFNVNYGSARK